MFLNDLIFEQVYVTNKCHTKYDKTLRSTNIYHETINSSSPPCHPLQKIVFHCFKIRAITVHTKTREVERKRWTERKQTGERNKALSEAISLGEKIILIRRGTKLVCVCVCVCVFYSSIIGGLNLEPVGKMAWMILSRYSIGRIRRKPLDLV